MATQDPLYTDWLHHQIRLQADAAAVYDLASKRQFTWQQFHERVDALAHKLLADGVQPGERVAYLGLNSSDVLEIFFATLRIGAVYVPLNFRLTPPELSFILGDCFPAAIFFDQSFFVKI